MTAARSLFLLLLPLATCHGWVVPSFTRRQHRSGSSLFVATEYSLDGETIRGPMTPLGNFCLVRTKDTLTATEGGILLPDQVSIRVIVLSLLCLAVKDLVRARIHRPALFSRSPARISCDAHHTHTTHHIGQRTPYRRCRFGSRARKDSSVHRCTHYQSSQRGRFCFVRKV